MPKHNLQCTDTRCYESVKNKGETIMNGTNQANPQIGVKVMSTYNCIECQREMLRNTFICDVCERDKRQDNKNKKKNNVIVRAQYTKVVEREDSSNEWGSPYWNTAYKTQPRDENGDLVEYDRANPDFVLKDRLDEMERMTKSNIDWFQAVALLPQAGEILSEEERICVTAFANGKTLRDIEKKFEMSRMTAQRKLKSGLKKLQKFYEDNYVA